MDNDTRTTLMQLILAMESYLYTETAQKKITGISAMSDDELRKYYFSLANSFEDAL